MMTIVLNGKEQTMNVDEPTLKNVLATHGVTLGAMVAVQLNGKILKREDLTKTRIKDKDKINLLFV
jgi:thiamine biosynthesis protein ThiS